MMTDSEQLPLQRLMLRLGIDTDRLARDSEPLLVDAACRCVECERWKRCSVLLENHAPVRAILEICPNFRMLDLMSPRQVLPH